MCAGPRDLCGRTRGKEMEADPDQVERRSVPLHRICDQARDRLADKTMQ